MLIQAVDKYLSVRRSVGFKLEETERYLRSFSSFADGRGDSHVVSESAIAWASRGPSEAQRDTRLKIVIRFARFARAEDEQHEIPPDGVFCGQRHRPTPYIFSDEEIRQVVAEASRLRPSGSLRPHTYSTLFGLLAVTGLRPSEGRRLKLTDLTTDGLVIRASKFRKTRLLPLHETTTAALQSYLGKRSKVAGHDEHFFVSNRERQLPRRTVSRVFRKVVEAAGIARDSGRSSPHLMDLRHTFAVRVLERCPDNRDHVRRHMLALTTYMGHARVEDTYWYLESTPELMVDIARATETFVEGGTP